MSDVKILTASYEFSPSSFNRNSSDNFHHHHVQAFSIHQSETRISRVGRLALLVPLQRQS